ARNGRFSKTLQLAKLQAIALALMKTDRPLTREEAEQVRRLLLRGASMGVRAQRRLSRRRMAFGLRSSTARTTIGMLLASNTQCSHLHGPARFLRRRA